MVNKSGVDSIKPIPNPPNKNLSLLYFSRIDVVSLVR